LEHKNCAAPPSATERGNWLTKAGAASAAKQEENYLF